VEGATDKHCLWSLANSSIPAPTMIITQRAGKWQEASDVGLMKLDMGTSEAPTLTYHNPSLAELA
jgi:hypothetical protein